MNFLDKVSSFYPALVRYGQQFGSRTTSAGNAQPIRILISRPNHRLGNLLLVTPIIQEVSNTFPSCKIDLFVKGKLGEILFKNRANIDRIIQLPKRPFQHLLEYINGWLQIRKYRYDIAINVDQSSSSGKLSIRFANARKKIWGNVIEDLKIIYPDYEHHAKFPVYNFRRHLETVGLDPKNRSIPPLDIKLNTSEITEGKDIMRMLAGNYNPTVSLYTYATGKKCYSTQWWAYFYERLKTHFPQVNFIEILPLHKTSVLSSRIASFYSTDVRQIGSLIANSALFIGGDSGIMHLASSVQTPTVGLFSVTDQNRYAPYHNESMSLDTNSVNIDGCLEAISLILNRRSLPSLAV
jgi:ADP-heptose:LPS heptosyltransferase